MRPKAPTGPNGPEIQILRVVHHPANLLELPPAEMDLALRLLRRSRLLSRVATRLHEQGLGAGLPLVVTDQLESARVSAEARTRSALWELDRLAWGLRELPDVPLVLMKGCAYVLAGTPNAAGRSFADVDLMAPERDLLEAEATLRRRGWVGKELTPYDDQYYRRWAHELPPMIHVEREVEVDLHRNLLMQTARLKPPATLLFEAARTIPGSRYKVLAPVDMVLHAMVHLFYGGDLDGSLRELVDIDDLLRHYESVEPAFWTQFWPRVEALDLARPAFYGLRYASRLLGTPVPAEVVVASRAGAPTSGLLPLMDSIVERSLFPRPLEGRRRWDSAARWLAFVRSHWVKMPPAMLLRHLSRKAVARVRAVDGRSL